MIPRPRAISRDEFIRVFRLCKPLASWPKTIAVGNSGGPDSTALLFLIRRCLSENANVPNLPRRVVSLHVNHSLQAASENMAEQCMKNAKALSVEHHNFKIPWSTENYPELPQEGAVEDTARKARFRTLFEGMTETSATVLALGHHANDQVETALMRIIKGSTADGASGMKHCRRWGMDFGYFGSGGPMEYEGMRRWIIRPLLTFPKDRLLATCEENGLPYVTDTTNFQPEVTLRNAIRKWLANNGQQDESDKIYLNVDILKKKLDDLELGIDVSAGIAPLYPAISALALRADDVDHEVDFILSRNALRAPPSTYLITHRTLESIENPEVQRAVVLRILRYASFHPWGSLAAQVNRRANSISQIVEKIWNADPFTAQIRPFCAGGGVLWSPVVIKGDTFRFVNNTDGGADVSIRDSQNFGWLASRQNPPKYGSISKPGEMERLRVDITSRILSRIEAGFTSPLEILYDNRFLITINLSEIPSDIQKSIKNGESEIWLVPQTRWFWPKVVLKTSGKPDDVTLHTAAQSPRKLVDFPNIGANEFDRWQKIYWRPYDKEIVAPWIDVSFERPLTRL
ncbi:hypothetical protein GYMLUDRAFT_202578 [Collybiopsis luxurians FD-317 M1]|uniref:tRNA(Ile)-lysidine synthetase n=1 Tax=Collybiopsis luxurians FD-317 M1 TaxID=944289 RepID=A0A0D0B4D7_9AGAR|nr:hypothetical protein GYMLUDRAFT_202578 [Collybiopsis luxurians FD-317 M1]